MNESIYMLLTYKEEGLYLPNKAMQKAVCLHANISFWLYTFILTEWYPLITNPYVDNPTLSEQGAFDLRILTSWNLVIKN